MNGFDLDKTARYFGVNKNSIVDIWYTYGKFGISVNQPAWDDKTKMEVVDFNVSMTKEEAIRDFGKGK